MEASSSSSSSSRKAKKSSRSRGSDSEEKKKSKKDDDERRQQKKEKKERKRKRREADSLVSEEHRQDIKRMRAWSKDSAAAVEREEACRTSQDASSIVTPPEESVSQPHRPRTRSMDLAEEEEQVLSMSAEAWRKEHNITVQRRLGGGNGNERESEDGDGIPDPFRTFRAAPFHDRIQRALEVAGFETPTPIQSQAWPIALLGADMICVAKTGSGKTCAFLLPAFHQHVQRLQQDQKDRPSPALQQHRGRGRGGGGRGLSPSLPSRQGYAPPVMLVLAPTRELSVQILQEAQRFGRPMAIRSVCCYGGASRGPQIGALERGVECVIATPGRLQDLIDMKKADLSQIRHLVLDEADRMLDMGFEPQIRAILRHLPSEAADRQTCLFSATWPREIQALAHEFLRRPMQINVGEVNALVANKDIEQHVIVCTEDEKYERLTEILNRLTGRPEDDHSDDDGRNHSGGRRPQQAQARHKHDKVIIFASKKVSCHGLADRLWEAGYAVDCLHGDRPQWERTRVMQAFREGYHLRMLVATDVAARGLDVKDVAVVVNYDMPLGKGSAVEDYVHRIGRTGRAGNKGTAYTLFTAADKKCANKLVELLKGAGQAVPAALQAMVRPPPRSYSRFGGGGGGRYYGGGRGGGRSYMGGGAGGGHGYRGGGRCGTSGRGGRLGGFGGGRGLGGGRGWGGCGRSPYSGRGSGRGGYG